MAIISAPEIMEWIEAPDVELSLVQLSGQAREAAVKAEQTDRQELVETAVAVRLLDLKQGREEERERLNRLLGEEILEVEAQLERVSTIHEAKRVVEPPLSLPDKLAEGQIPPFSIRTKGLTDSQLAYLGDHYKAFRSHIADKLPTSAGQKPHTSVLGRVASYLSGVGTNSGDLPKDSFKIQPGKGVTVFNSDLRAADLEAVKGIGSDVAAGIMKFIETTVVVEDLRDTSTLINLDAHRESKDRQATG